MNKFLFLPLIIIVVLTGCFSNKNEPQIDDILSALKFKLPIKGVGVVDCHGDQQL